MSKVLEMPCSLSNPCSFLRLLEVGERISFPLLTCANLSANEASGSFTKNHMHKICRYYHSFLINTMAEAQCNEMLIVCFLQFLRYLNINFNF